MKEKGAEGSREGSRLSADFPRRQRPRGKIFPRGQRPRGTNNSRGQRPRGNEFPRSQRPRGNIILENVKFSAQSETARKNFSAWSLSTPNDFPRSQRPRGKN